MDPAGVVRRSLDRFGIGKPNTDAKVASKKRKPEVKLKAYGTYFYPPIWIGEVPQRTFREKSQKHLLPQFKEHISTIYKGFQTIVRQDGLLAIVNESRSGTLDMLNEIMGAALILGLPCYAIREPEVADITIDRNTLAITGWNISLVSERTRQADLWEERTARKVRISPTLILSEEDVLEIISRANRITRDTGIAKSLLFLLESFTHLQSSEYAQCFVMGWTVVESYITSLWDDFIKEKSITGKRKEKLKSTLLWTADDIVETLNLAGAMANEIYDNIMSLKNRRNKILHRRETATQEDAEQCFNLAAGIVQSSVAKLGELHVIQPNRRLLGIND